VKNVVDCFCNIICKLLYVNFSGSLERLYWIWGGYESLFKKSSAESKGTLDSIMEIIVWSFQILFAGVYPHKDHRGKEPFGCMCLY